MWLRQQGTRIEWLVCLAGSLWFCVLTALLCLTPSVAPLPRTPRLLPQAFLVVLQLLQKGNPLTLVQQAGELYRLLAADGHASWQDYLLDQVGRGRPGQMGR